MTKRKLMMITFIFLFSLTGFRFIWLYYLASPEQPIAVQGELNLQHWEALSDHTLKLDGEWEFYPNTLLFEEASAMMSAERTPEHIHVPGNWSLPAALHDKPKNYGYASYRLRITVNPEQGQTYGLYIPSIRSSAEVFINGKRMAQSGQPGSSKANYLPLDVPFVTYFTIPAQNETIEIIIQVANFDDPVRGGIVRSPKFGKQENLLKYISFAHNMVGITCVIFLLHAIYGFVLFFIGNRDRRLLYFSLMLIFVVLGTLLDGERLLFMWLKPPFHFGYKLTFSCLIIGGYLLMLCIRHMLSERLQGIFFKSYSWLCTLVILLILIMPTSVNLAVSMLYLCVILIPCLLTLALLYRTTRRIHQDNLLLLLAAIAAIHSLIWLFIIESKQIHVISYPFDLMISLICFALYWFKTYFNVLAETQELTSKLQEADKQKDDFLVTVAHELRNPLHGLLNISQSIAERERATLHESSARDLELLHTVGRRMSYMLNDLLDIARLKENRITLQLHQASLQVAANNVTDMLRFMTEGKPIRLIQSISSQFPLVIADENRLIQILFNLVHNAVKYTYSGDIVISAIIKQHRAYISVADSGHGIEQDKLQRIFEPYEQAQGRLDAVAGGFGLGLSICKHLVELHGGELSATSKIGHGSTFTFSLPLAMESGKIDVPHAAYNQTAATSATARVQGPFNAMEAYPLFNDATANFDRTCILVVDDDPINLRVIESIFAAEHYEITSVTSGEEVLSLLDRGAWDLLIADVMMPNMSGYELTSRIRERFSMAELPILLLTALNRDEDIEAGFRIGANDYVVKPMNAAELKARVHSLTKLKKSVSERLRIEAAWLQAQIKPHFLINTFTAIAALSKIDMNRMDALVEELSNYMRLSIDFQNSDRAASLEHELKLVRSYLSIQQERFGDRLQIIWEVDGRIEIDIPPLTIQPLVENAVTHGVLKRSNGGEVIIQILDKNTSVEISITDNGVGMDQELLDYIRKGQPDRSIGIGLLNTDQRLKQYFGSGLHIQSELGKGTRVSFSLIK